MQGFWLEGFVCRKAIKSRSLISYFSFQVLVQLTILGEHLSNSIHGGNNYLSSSNKIHHHIFHLLLYVVKVFKQSHTVRSGLFESNFLILQGKPNSHVTCNFRRHTDNIFPFFPGCGTGSPSSTTKYDDSAPACARMRNDVQRR